MFENPRLVMATLVLLALNTSSMAQTDVAKVIVQLEDELNAAFNRYDSATLNRLWGEELVFISPNGALANKAERLAGLKSPPPNIPTSTNESVDVKMYGSVAVAIVISRWVGTNAGNPFSALFRATHVWTNRAGRWQLVAAHVSQMKQ